MKYKLHITKTALNDLDTAAEYIEFTLKSPKAADDLLEAADKNISQLSKNPLIHPLVKDPVLNAWGYRFIKVNNYLVFYIVEKDTVHIMRFLYGKRNWSLLLKEEIDF